MKPTIFLDYTYYIFLSAVLSTTQTKYKIQYITRLQATFV